MAVNIEKIKSNPNYQELVKTRSSLGWTLTWITLAIYLGFILLIAFDKPFLATKLGANTVMTIGLPVGLFVIISAFVITGIYVRKANATFDELNRKVVEETK